MDEQRLNGHQGPDADVLRRLRLKELLRDLVRERGRMEAAALMGVNYKTLVRAEESGRLTGRMMHALERLQLSGDAPTEAAQRERVAELERRVGLLEAGLEALAEELREAVRDRTRKRDESPRLAPERSGKPRATGPAPQARGPAPAISGLQPRRLVALRRPFPDVVTVEPAGDDAEVYGDAWPLVEEWRRLRAGHPDGGGGVRWLETEERILVLELAMLEEHGLTLPPEPQPLRGFARKGQTGWRRTALYDTQRALVWAKLRRWVRRVLTLGLWWR